MGGRRRVGQKAELQVGGVNGRKGVWRCCEGIGGGGAGGEVGG